MSRLNCRNKLIDKIHSSDELVYIIFVFKDLIDIIEENIPFAERIIMTDISFDIIPSSHFSTLIVLGIQYRKKVHAD